MKIRKTARTRSHESNKEKILDEIELSGREQSYVSDLCNALIAVNFEELAP